MRNLSIAAVLCAALAIPASATVTSTARSVSYTGNAVTTSFTVPFKFLANTDLVVSVAGATKVLNTDYTVKGAGNATGTVTFVTAPASSAAVVITRTIPLTQGTSVRNALPAPAGSTIESALDRQVMIAQQLQSSIANPVLPQALTNATPVQGRGTTTPLQLQDWVLAQGINVKGEGAIGDGIQNDAAGLQAAANLALSNGGTVLLPCGTYIVNSTISLTPTFFGITFQGVAPNCVTIKAGAAMTSVISFTDTGANGRFVFRNLTIDGNALAQYGIKSTQFRYGKLEKIVVQGTTVAGAYFTSGWDIVIRDSEFVNNTGDGFVLGDSTGNDLTLDKVLLTSNSGFGARFYGGGPIVMRGGAVQLNAKGGLYFVSLGRPAVVDGVYFEANAQTGATFTTPAKTVKADIIANGVGVAQADTNLGFSFPSPNVTVRNCLFTQTYTEAAIYAVAASAMNVAGNFAPVAVPLLKTWGDSTFSKPQNVAIWGNVGFSKDWDVDSITTSRSLAFSTWASDSVTRINYFPRSIFAMPKVATSSGTSVLKRGAKFQGNETYEVDQGAGDTFGIVLDTTVNTELASQLVYISAWAKVSATTAGPRLLFGGKANTASLATDTNWHHIEFADFAPASGTAVIGFGKLGSTGADVVTFSRVVVSIVGAPDREFIGDQITPTWATTAAPTIGTWARGDTIWNSQPSIGSILGWSCVIAGTPGTWTPMGTVGVGTSGVTLVTSTQASLGSPNNGTLYYCSDCTVANPCAGGGTGALAKRINGAWVCN